MSSPYDAVASTSASASRLQHRRRNRPHFESVHQLLQSHRRLVNVKVEITTRESSVADIVRHSLLQTVIRMHVSVKNKRETLRNYFFDLFREHSESLLDGFEVVTSFNAILANQVRKFFISLLTIL